MRTLLLALLFLTSLHAADALKSAKLLHYESVYTKAVAKAKKEHKMVLLVFVQDPCPYCDRLVHKTLATPCVQRRMKNYVPVIIDKNGVYPKKLKPPFIPISYVVDPHSEEITFEIVGAIPFKDYIHDLETELEFRDVEESN